jgi:hypothetical protein
MHLRAMASCSPRLHSNLGYPPEEWNESVRAWEAKRYTVVKVHKHDEDGQLKFAFAKETKKSPKKVNVKPETNGKRPFKKKPPKKRSPSKAPKRKKQ